jgi:hypothetical protein
MSVELHRPHKPEENQKNFKFFNGKNHTLPGIRTQNLCLAVGSLVLIYLDSVRLKSLK